MAALGYESICCEAYLFLLQQFDLLLWNIIVNGFVVPQVRSLFATARIVHATDPLQARAEAFAGQLSGLKPIRPSLPEIYSVLGS